MFLVTHAAMGVLLAEQIPNYPWLGFFLAFAIHYAVDIIPHGDSKLYQGYVSGTKVKRALAYVGIDAIATLFFVLLVVNANMYASLEATSLAIVGSVLPDFFVAICQATHGRRLKTLHRIHFYFHNMVIKHRGDVQFASGVAVQMIFLSAVLSRIG